MYTLLSGLYKYVFQKDEYCILILGLDNAGKTTFLEQSKTRFNKDYRGMSLSKITTTVGLNIGTVDVGKARLMFWDLGGQEELQSLWDKVRQMPHNTCPSGHVSPGSIRGVFLPFLIRPQTTSSSGQQFRHPLFTPLSDDILSSFELREFVANEHRTRLTTAENIRGEGTAWCQRHHQTAFSDCTSKIGRRDCLTQACSALTGNGVREGIEWMVKCVVRNVRRPPRHRDIT
ncbi:PREDICTED: ADP-ribosylation factor-related protein 1 [Hipposideros armiger]|uniref:ADP-ribosylation factor-related protein 1 n=1 Tax=Hipposideros armiger TaxID=186990 RepID=A0A8B7QV62_HIPAR|nr:PREDICTED: ADP-ribosylation factor-related protein 1 [Hipposideros armiger]